MSAEERKKAYLAKAKEAEAQAQRTPNRLEKQSWQKIAQGTVISRTLRVYKQGYEV
jgi:hypothetical protein